MLSEELIAELHNLQPADKLRAVQLLVNDLAEQEMKMFESDAQYEVWSPFDAAGAAETLMKMLEADKETDNA